MNYQYTRITDHDKAVQISLTMYNFNDKLNNAIGELFERIKTLINQITKNDEYLKSEIDWEIQQFINNSYGFYVEQLMFQSEIAERFNLEVKNNCLKDILRHGTPIQMLEFYAPSHNYLWEEKRFMTPEEIEIRDRNADAIAKEIIDEIINEKKGNQE